MQSPPACVISICGASGFWLSNGTVRKWYDAPVSRYIVSPDDVLVAKAVPLTNAMEHLWSAMFAVVSVGMFCGRNCFVA